MESLEFRNHLRKQPFEPFRVTLTNGRGYDVLHPELALAGHHSAALGMPRLNWSEPPLFDRVIIIQLEEIRRIEAIPPESPYADIAAALYGKPQAGA